MLKGKYKGSRVTDVKHKIQSEMLHSKQAILYHEPEEIVISHSGDQCIAAVCEHL